MTMEIIALTHHAPKLRRCAPIWKLVSLLALNKMKQYFGAKYNQIQQRNNQKIIQMKKKTYRKIECEKTISSSTESNNIVSQSKQVRDSKPVRKLTKYMKIGSSGSGTSRAKMSSKQSSSNRQNTSLNQTSILKKRRGSTISTSSNNTSRYCSTEDPKRKNITSRDSVKMFHSVRKTNESQSKTSCMIIPSPSIKSNISQPSFTKCQSKCSLPGKLSSKFSNSNMQAISDIGSVKALSHKANTSLNLSNWESSLTRAKHIMSTGSIGSQSSSGSNNHSAVCNLKDINKLLLAKNMNLDHKEIVIENESKDSKVYTYKLNQLISIIKSTQDSGASKKSTKSSVKKGTSTKAPTAAYTKKTCRKMPRACKKIAKKQFGKSTVTSRLFVVIFSLYSKEFIFDGQWQEFCEY